MEISIREWEPADFEAIQKAWLDFCRTATRSDMRLKPNCESAMRQWLLGRFKEPNAFGFIAESGGVQAGFIIGRIDEWESTPPVLEARMLGLVDAVYVSDRFRRHGVGARL